MTQKERIQAILNRLDGEYGTEYRCYLDHENAWQLLIATILSAQCTDARVNIVTKDLFVKYPSVEAFANADVKELEKDIHSTGFYHNKAVNIIGCFQVLFGTLCHRTSVYAKRSQHVRNNRFMLLNGLQTGYFFK